MSHLSIFLKIVDFQPNNFDFYLFGFHFISENKDLEDEITVKIIINFK